MKAVILAGGQEIGRCPLSMIRPRPLFPLMDDVLLQPMLRRLKALDVDEAIICANGKTHLLREHFEDPALSPLPLAFHDDAYPRGTAGCLQDLHESLKGDRFLVLEGGLYLDGDLPKLLDDHIKSGAALTVGAVPADQRTRANDPLAANGKLSPLGAYVMEPDVLEHVPARGYYDIKEQLIPRLRKLKRFARPALFNGRHQRVFDASSYATFIERILSGALSFDGFDRYVEIAHRVWAAPGAFVAPSATLIGPIVIGCDSSVGEGATITGPTLICNNVLIDDQSFIAESILWPNSSVGLGARVVNSIVSDSFRVSVFSNLNSSIAIERDLALGQLHGLTRVGYGIETHTARTSKVSWSLIESLKAILTRSRPAPELQPQPAEVEPVESIIR